ncbi:MAG: GTPase Era [Bdellovibrionota bacterium]
MKEQIRKCGFVGLIGRPNAGKSTLLNACIGTKLAGVSKKPQTTRNRILGIDILENTQTIFLDTPGMHRSTGKAKINHLMNKEAWGVLEEADIICYLIDCKFGWHPWDEDTLRSLLQQCNVPIMILATKTDLEKKNIIEKQCELINEKIDTLITELEAANKISARIIQPYPYLISSKRPEEIRHFKSIIADMLPEGPFLYNQDDITDRPQSFIISEMIREQIFRQLGNELPYGTSVTIDKYEQLGSLTKIMASIIVTQQSHKPIVLGKGGSRIRAIGASSRITIEKHLDNKVFLDLFVKVQENWIEDPALISQLQGIY